MSRKRSALVGAFAAACMAVFAASPAGAAGTDGAENARGAQTQQAQQNQQAEQAQQDERARQPEQDKEVNQAALDAQKKTKTIRYGPFNLDAASEDGHAHMPNTPRLFVESPCADCYIKTMTPDLVYEDGSNANVDTGPMLHHVVFFNMFERDPVCGTEFNASAILGERFMAAGNERTEVPAPDGYGYYNSGVHAWNLIIELMNVSHEQKTVYLEMEYEYLPGSANAEHVQPVWMSVAGCYVYDTFTAPAGRSETNWEWDVNVPGKIVGMGGHVHQHGKTLTATNLSTGREICRSVAEEGGSPEYIDHHGETYVSSMSRCIGENGNPVATLEKGQTVELSAVYDSENPVEGAMGIMLTYIDQQD